MDRDIWAVFGQMKSQFKLTGGFLNQHLAFPACYFFISTEISPDTLPKFQLIMTSRLSSVHCCSLRGAQKYLLLLNK